MSLVDKLYHTKQFPVSQKDKENCSRGMKNEICWWSMALVSALNLQHLIVLTLVAIHDTFLLWPTSGSPSTLQCYHKVGSSLEILFELETCNVLRGVIEICQCFVFFPHRWGCSGALAGFNLGSCIFFKNLSHDLWSFFELFEKHLCAHVRCSWDKQGEVEVLSEMWVRTLADLCPSLGLLTHTSEFPNAQVATFQLHVQKSTEQISKVSLTLN